MEAQYIISAELDLPRINSDGQLLAKNIENFRISLNEDLRSQGKNTIWIPSGDLTRGLRAYIERATTPVVSLDNRYIDTAAMYFGVSRGIDNEMRDVGYVPRVGSASLSSQLDKIAGLGREVLLADDVVFSGKMIAWASEELRKRGTKVKGVIAGVAINEGVQVLEKNDIDVEAVMAFDSIEDEICERDFALVAGSGRRMDSLGANALYFDTDFGRPNAWASIQMDQERNFCINSIERSMMLCKPGVPMERYGTFYGYNRSGDVQEVLKRRMEELA